MNDDMKSLGTFIWHELMTPDPEGEGRFYSQVFGWNVVPVDMGRLGMYHLQAPGPSG